MNNGITPHFPLREPSPPRAQNLASVPADSNNNGSSGHLEGAAETKREGEGGDDGKRSGGDRQHQQNLAQGDADLAAESAAESGNTAGLRGDPAAPLENAGKLQKDPSALLETVAGLGGGTEEDKEMEVEGEVDIPDELEDIVEALLCGLRDRDTVVRWSSAKGIGRITERLTQDLGKHVCACVLTPKAGRDTVGLLRCSANIYQGTRFFAARHRLRVCL